MNRDDVLMWLLGEDNASVRYYALRDLLERKEDDRELKEAKDAIPKSLIIGKIFSRQKGNGSLRAHQQAGCMPE